MTKRMIEWGFEKGGYIFGKTLRLLMGKKKSMKLALYLENKFHSMAVVEKEQGDDKNRQLLNNKDIEM